MTQKEITYIDNIKLVNEKDVLEYRFEIILEDIKLKNSFDVKCIPVYQPIFVDKYGKINSQKSQKYIIKTDEKNNYVDYQTTIKSSIEFSYKLCEILKQYEYVYKIIVEPKTVYKNSDGTIIESGEIDLNVVKKENFIHSSNILNVTIRGVKYGEKTVEE